MSDQYEPVRWLDDPDAGAALRADLSQGIGVMPSGIDYGASLVSLRGAIAAQTASLPVAASGTSMFSLGMKIAVGAVLVTGIAVWASRGNDDEAEASRIASARIDPEPSRAAAVDAPTDVREPVRATAAPVPPTPSRDTSDEIEILEPLPAEAGTDASPEASPEARLTDDEHGERSRAKRRGETEGLDSAAERAGADRPDDAPSADTDRYVREARLVAQARRKLASDPARALELTEALEREFPDGLLEEERRALAIRALTQLGRADQADAAAKSFLVEFPDGPHAAAVRRAIEPSNAAP